MESFLFGLNAFFTDPAALLIFAAALMGGLTFGAIPGLSGITLATILLPVSVFMTSTHAIMMFAVIYVSGVFGGGVTAILFNIPGDSNNAPTTFDGYPMTKKGEAGKAVGAAITFSALGGVASVILMMVATEPLAYWAVRAFGAPEIFALVIFGLSVAASAGASSAWKGWLSVALGLLIATVGTSPMSGQPRFDFGITYLQAGIGFVPLLLGFFAVSEVFYQGHRLVAGLAERPKASIDFPSLLEFWRLRFAVLRSMLIGFFAGVLPGIGATLAAFLSYSEAVRWSRHPERFGKGELEGVVAPETANNAATGAAMIPLLAIGIPGGASTAIMLAAFLMHGIEPGPLLMIASHDLVWTVFVAMLFANLCIFILGYIQTKIIVHLLRIPFRLLGPGILLIAIIGAYAVRNSVLDVWVVFVAGIVGYMLRRTGYSTAGLVLGVILGNIGERSFVQAMPIMHYDLFGFFERPIAATLIIGAVASIGFNIYRSLRQRRSRLAKS